MINNIASVLEGVTTVAIAGHVRPDGDCVGSCMGMYLYLKENYPQIQADVYLEEVPEVFHFIQDIDKAKQEWEDKAYDLFLGFDVSSIDRIGVAGRALETAKMTACIDHHITNKGLAQKNQYDVVAEMLEEIVPCNLQLNLSLLYNQYRTLKPYPHIILAQFTHWELRNLSIPRNLSAAVENIAAYTVDDLARFTVEEVADIGIRKKV